MEPIQKISFREDNTLLINGKPFFPLGTYRDPTESNSDFQLSVEAGFNLVHSYSFEESVSDPQKAKDFLDAAYKNGIYAFLGVYRKYVNNNTLSEVVPWVNALKGHPALLSWYLYDEPAPGKQPPEVISRLNSYIRQQNTHIPTSLLLAPSVIKSGDAADYINTADIMWTDIYPIPTGPLSTVGEYTNKLMDFVNKKKPVWIVLQAYDRAYLRDPKKVIEAQGNPTRPTMRESRVMAYRALVNGARGLIWYWRPKTQLNVIKDSPEVWNGLKVTLAELNRIYPFLVADQRLATIRTVNDVTVYTIEHNRQNLIIVVNDTTREVSMTLPELTAGTATAVEGRQTRNVLGPRVTIGAEDVLSVIVTR